MIDYKHILKGDFMTDDTNKPLKLPKNTDLPFFAYGIFKPNQIAYSRIEKYVKKHYEDEIKYKMLMRDGVPLIVSGKSRNHKTEGNLIYFKENKSKKAYKNISDTHSEKLYYWSEIKVGENKANVLMGADPDLGSTYLDVKVGNYTGNRDPFFKEAVKLAENELHREWKGMRDIEGFFKLQMAYMLLWASIERYCSLKYDNYGSKVNKLSKDELFKKSLKKHVGSEERTIYSADDLTEYTLNPEEPYESIRYYYTIRCNVVHRGKEIFNDEKMLRQSLKELLNIFNDILHETFM